MLRLPNESVFAMTKNALFLSNSEGKVLAVNEAACILFGYSEPELKALTIPDILQFDEKLRQLLIAGEKEGKAQGEVTGICKNGERFPCEYSSVKFITSEGQRRNSTEIIDIRKWKSAEDKLRRSEENLRAIFDHTTEGFVLVNTKLEIITFNDKAGEIIFEHNTRKAVAEGSNLLDYLPKDRREAFRQVAARAISGYAVEYEKEYAFEGGEIRWFSFSVNPVKEVNKVVGLCISGREITKQKKAEQELMEAQRETAKSEEKYRKIFNLSPMPKWIYDLQTLCILEVNEEALRHYGYTREEFLSMTILDIRPPEDIDAVHEVLRGLEQSLEKPLNFWRHRKKNGDIMLVDITGHPIEYNGRNARMVICRDVTEKIKNQAALMRSNERFRQAARASSDAIWDWDFTANTIFLGEGFDTLFGYVNTGETVERGWIEEKLHPDERSRVIDKFETVLSGNKQDHWQDEYRFRKADGTYAIICNSIVLIRDEEGKPLRMIGAMKDVTNVKEEEYHLKLLESVITNATDAVIIISAVSSVMDTPEVIFANPAFYTMTGYTPKEIKKFGMRLLHGAETDLTQIDKLKEAMKQQKSCQIQAVFYKKSGAQYWASLAISPVRDDAGNVKNYITIERDITERMNYLTAIEEQNAQLREIAWFQSHIMRAPLARIMGLTELLIDNPSNADAGKFLAMLKTSADELDEVIKEILRKTDYLKETKS